MKQIFYKESSGFSIVDIPVQEEIKIAIRNAAEHFRMNGLDVAKAPIGSLQELIECGLAQFFTIKDIPLILRDAENPKKVHNVYKELFKSIFGKSKYSFAGLFFAFLYETNGLIPQRRIAKYVNTLENYRQEFLVSQNRIFQFNLEKRKLTRSHVLNRKCSEIMVYYSIPLIQRPLYITMIRT